MSTSSPPRSAAVPLALAALAAAALAAASVPAARAGESPVGELGLWLALAGLGAAAAFHRPFGQRGMAAGAAALPLSVALAGPAAAGWTAAAVVVVSEVARGLVGRRWPVGPPNRLRPMASFGTAGRAVLAGLAGAYASWLVAGGGGSAFLAAAAGAAALLAVSLGLRAGERSLRVRSGEPGPRGRLLWRRRRPSPREAGGHLGEAAAWLAGAALAAVAAAAGPLLAVGLLGALATLALEAARQAARRAAADERLGDMHWVRSAGQRMVGGLPELEAAVDRIREECTNVVPALWFQLDLVAPGEAPRSWWAGEDGRLGEGEARPPDHPPTLPGIHRRSGWRLVERTLAWGERAVGRVRLWCDPRRLEPADLELLEALLPQMAASIHQSLLDREAREDPLTGTAVRRVLENRLHEAFRAAVDDGRALAVVMCDVDRFKGINDAHGHPAGDRALAEVAAVLDEHKRDGDLLARYGGEEFTLLLDRTDGPAALAVAERLRRAVEETAFEIDGAPVPLTVSAGAASCPELTVKTPSELLLLADAALYEAKRQGRNRCLLDLGRGRYQAPDGETIETGDPRPAPRAPRIFA